ncbi:MAG TPA: radical SAM family heme chaperone HemW [Desulfobacteraceae bacterium]|nr:radical SAM family heme chaperone HemW [Deltaproteobacteria bacterium]MBW2355190.1 radical SAM family heme chaperone HemW [Deltaproteobacteria bacterium]HDI59360.1 radical SAM family heme chaperone HemW [Desulfobacteraceae bacterium]
MPSPPAGIYIHLPFCLRKCLYCDFYSEVGTEERRRCFLAALRQELLLRADRGLAADSLYFGGGTPSLFAPTQLGGLIDGIGASFHLSGDSEITLEANPGTVTRSTLQGFRAAGVNRLNLGIQSFNDQNLAFLGRVHDARAARRAMDNARAAGFEDIGLDLIYGLPGQDPVSWQADLQAALEAAPAHLSCYMLTYAPGTPLNAARIAGRIHPLPEAAVADLFEITVQMLTERGFVHYEIANFARAGSPPSWSRHNRKYWNQAPYLGFGPAAHSFDGSRRSWNHADLDAYLEALENSHLPPGGEEILTREQQMIEAVFLGLRQIAGIDVRKFEADFGVEFDAVFGPALADLAEAGLALREAGFCRLTRRGLLVADAAAARMAACC